MKVFHVAAVLAVLAGGLAACGDTRSNQELNGVATWPLGGPASGPYQEPVAAAPIYSPTYSYGAGETTTTVTTTTVRPAYR